MSQTTTGSRAILNNPWIYDASQYLLGTWPTRRVFFDEYVRPFTGARMLEIGCGPGTNLRFIPKDADFTGLDLSEEYIRHANRRYGQRANYYAKDVATLKDEGERFDIIFSYGILHHISDENARIVFETVQEILEPGGRYVTFDPAIEQFQFWLARKLVDWDRGDSVRTPKHYEELARSAFANVECTVRHDLWFMPVTGNLFVCTKPAPL